MISFFSLCRNKRGVGESTGDAKSGLGSPKVGWQMSLNLKRVELYFFVRLLRTSGLNDPRFGLLSMLPTNPSPNPTLQPGQACVCQSC